MIVFKRFLDRSLECFSYVREVGLAMFLLEV